MDNSVRIIISENETFKLYNSDQALADRLASYLTDLVRNPELSKEIISYRDNRRLQDESNAALNQELGKFIRGVKLQTKKLRGMCYQCRSAK